MVEERADWQAYEFACEADTIHAYEWCKKNLPWEDVTIVHDQPKLRFRNRSVWQQFVEGYNPFGQDEEPKKKTSRHPDRRELTKEVEKREGFTFVCNLPDWYDARDCQLIIHDMCMLILKPDTAPHAYNHKEKKWLPLTFSK